MYLKLGLLLLCMLGLTGSMGLFTPVAAIEHYDVVVVGAGAAGIAATRTLVDAGLSVLVLEALDDYDGRIHTICWNATDDNGAHNNQAGCLDAGPMFVHHEYANVLIPTIDELGIDIQLFDQADSAVFDLRRYINPNRVGSDVGNTLDIVAEAEQYIAFGVSDAQTEQLAGYNFTDYKVETIQQFFFEQDYGNNLEYHESTDIDNRTDDQIGPDHVVPTGWRSIMKAIVERSPSIHPNMLFGSRVYEILYSENITSGAAFVSYTRNGQNFTVRADVGVIVTPSINVIKSGMIDFIPDLPASFMNSMNKIICSEVDKVMLFFKEQNFPSDHKLDHNYIYRYSHVPNSRINDALTCFVNWNHVYGHYAVSSFYQGDFARMMQNLTDQQIIAKHMAALKEIHPDFPCQPDSYHISRNGKNPYFLCSYSTFGVGSTHEDMAYLATPLGYHNNLVFAGEAINTFPEDGTVNGAYGSGLAAAAHMIQLHSSMN